MGNSTPAYQVSNLRKIYHEPSVVANDGISFVVHPGEAFGLLGPNGAGKTTLVKQLVGLLSPSSGEVRLFGESLSSVGERSIGRAVAYLPQGLPSLGELRVREAITWTGMLRGVGKVPAVAEADALIGELELASVGDRQLRKLSGGQRRLVQIAMTLIGHSPVVILDEPTADVDPALRKRIWQMLAALARGGTAVILVTHDVAEAEQALDRVAIMAGGSIVVTGTPAELKARLAHHTRVDVVISKEAALDPAILAGDLAEDALVHNRRISAWVPSDEAIRRLEKLMSAVDLDMLEDVRLVTPTLEDVYLETTGRQLATGEGR